MTVLGEMERDGIAVDVDYLDDLQSTFAAEARCRQGRVRARSAGRSTSARPSSCRWCCSTSWSMPKTKRTKTGYTTDADALRQPARADRAPVPHHLLRHRDVTRLKTTVEGCASRSATTAGSTPPSSRPSPRPAGCPHRTEPAEHPDPHRRGPADPRAFVPGTARRAADRGLLADRDADHGAPVRGRRPDRGVQLRRGPAHVRRDAGVRVAGRARSPRSCGGGSRRCPTGWPTGCRRSACPGS